ncbi:ATPase family associated with various cellular activities (AAA) [Hibiscus syriacus]|uniref:RING-type E3 ubiquitin transferase n=1 Tax=Hibiscus syriacus TaxID=106335 RepID=A0A6A3BD91_HIBSY|nr:ATPase family associated with various cellular activities (AAA) [Hibiscus syriacus]
MIGGDSSSFETIFKEKTPSASVFPLLGEKRLRHLELEGISTLRSKKLAVECLPLEIEGIVSNGYRTDCCIEGISIFMSKKLVDECLPLELEAMLPYRLCNHLDTNRNKAGTCPYVTNCNFAHSIEELRRPPPNWQEIVAAHEEEKGISSEPSEEFQIPSLGSNSFSWETQRSYKGRHCKKFYTEEGCPYGDSCTFFHDEQSKNGESVGISLGPGGYGGGGGLVVGEEVVVVLLLLVVAVAGMFRVLSHLIGRPDFFQLVVELHRYGGSVADTEVKDSSAAPSDLKQVGGVPSKTLTDTISALVPSVPHSDVYHLGVPSQCMVEILLRIWHNRRSPSPPVDIASTEGEIMNNGLDPELIQAFPTFYYSTVKEFRSEKYGLECAICLEEFNDDDMLQLLTICCHVYHKGCVDLWLESHKTCPVCRGEFDVPRKSFEKSPLFVRSNSMREMVTNQSSVEDSVCINIKDDNDDKVDRAEDEAEATSSAREEQLRRRERMENFSRSHSTGHSIGRNREDDRYTLRLPDQVKIKLVRGHHAVKSCIVFGEFTNPSNDRNSHSIEASETRGGYQHG